DSCFSKPCDSSACFKENGFVLSCSKYKLATGDLFSSTHAWKEFMVRKLHEPKSLISETDFIGESVLKLGILCSETDKPWHVLKSLLENCVVLSFDDILVYNTFFEKHVDPLISDSQFQLNDLCSDFEKIRQI